MRSATRDAPERITRIVGFVNSDGSIIVGGPFTAVRIGVGQYTVRLQGVRAVKSVSAVINSSAGTILISMTQPNTIGFLYYSSAWAYVDGGFMFSADCLAL